MMKNAARSLLLLLALAAPAGAQYPGRLESNKKATPTVRAVAVLEWTGEMGKPSASRIIPISVFDGEQYQPGGLYLAKPQPLALEPGTEYVLEDAGVARGLFDINTAQDVDGYWFGYGAWKPMAAPPKKAKPKQGRNMPQVVNDGGTAAGPISRARVPAAALLPRTSITNRLLRQPVGFEQSSCRRPGSSYSAQAGGQSSSSPAPSASSTETASAPETAIGGADPDRPRMIHGQQTPKDEFQPARA